MTILFFNFYSYQLSQGVKGMRNRYDKRLVQLE